MINDTLSMMLFVGVIISFIILGFFIWGAKDGHFDDSQKMMGGLLFDSEEDLNDAVNKERKKKELKSKQKIETIDKKEEKSES